MVLAPRLVLYLNLVYGLIIVNLFALAHHQIFGSSDFESLRFLVRLIAGSTNLAYSWRPDAFEAQRVWKNEQTKERLG